MIRTVLIIGALACSFTACNAQATSKAPQRAPKIDSKVNKQYDEKGNLISYDSTYTEFYSNIDGDSLLHDSLFDHFRQQFTNHQRMFGQWNQTDSLFMGGFAPFPFDDQFNAMNRLMREVDSMQNQMIRKHLRHKNVQPAQTKSGITM